MSGAGRLTLARIDTIQNFYGRAIRDNQGNAKEMAKSTQAILKHYSSTLEKPQRDNCPVGSSSWCSYQRDIANGTNLHKPIKNPFNDAIVEVMQPLFDRLGDETFLVGSENCYTQNRNECLHHVIWGMASKEVYSSPPEISLSISLGVLQFNQGFNATYAELLPTLGMQVHLPMLEAWKKIDLDRIYQADYRSSADVKQQRKAKRKSKLKRQDAFVHQEGIMYKSQAFHGGKTMPIRREANQRASQRQRRRKAKHQPRRKAKHQPRNDTDPGRKS